VSKTFRFATAIAASLTVYAAIAADISQTSEEKKMAAPGPGEAAVYFVRPAMMGMAINFWAFVDETPVGVTKGHNYVWTTVPAGEHLIWSSSGNESAIKMNLEAGKSYYFEQKAKMGGIRARVELEPLAEADRAAAFEKCKYSTLTADGVAKGKEILAEHHADAVTAAAQAANK
jgi:uncharacterized protein DUF2846